jgi:hypothetical protein
MCAALGAFVLATLLSGCSSPPLSSPDSSTEIPVSPPTEIALATQDVPTPVTAEATQETAPAVPVFTVAVIADLQSEPVARAQAEAVLREAGTFLQPLTSISLVMTDFVEDGAGGSTSEIASRYITANAAASPNGLVIFSFGDNGQARLVGGYGYAIAGPPGFRNTFASPVVGSSQMYVAVVHFSHRYAACGYGSSDTVQSGSALDGECRNQPGMACTQHNGYSMCADSVPHLFASTPTYFVSSTIVHELMHPFSAGGDLDHYNTPECNTRMGYPPQFYDLQESQYHNGLCPYVYEAFGRSFQP